MELVEHWRWEVKQKSDVEEQEDQEIPHAEVRPTLDVGSCHDLKQEPSIDVKTDLVKGEPDNVEGVFVCHQCDKTFTKDIYLNRHIRTVHRDRSQDEVVQCDDCDYKCTSTDTLRQHWHRKHKNMDSGTDETFYCNNCDYTCTKKDTLQKHKRTKHSVKNENDVGKFDCDICGYTCDKRDTLRVHRHINHNEAMDTNIEETFECEQCEYTCTKKDTLQKHRRLKHGGGMSYCDQCDYSCTKNEVLIMHKFRKHGCPEPEKKCCDKCAFTCFTSGGLRYHNKSEHSEIMNTTVEENFECGESDNLPVSNDTLQKQKRIKRGNNFSNCDQCDYSCTKNSVLSIHKFRKHGYPEPPKNFCDQCGFSCFGLSGLRKHKHAKHGNGNPNHECKQCGYACWGKLMFKMHMYKNHDGPAPEKKLCDMCSFTCFWPSMLLKHKNQVHLGIVNSFQCDQCEFSVRSIGSLRRHQEQQHGREATHMCHLCDFRTSYAPNLKVHIKTQHSDTVYHCDQCGFETKNQSSLSNHTRGHDETKSSWFKCDYCDYLTPAKGNLKTHTEAKHMGIRHPCPVPECNFVGYLKNDLRLHNKTVHLGISTLHKCDYCDYSHLNIKQVKKHYIAKHTNIKYACPHCSYKTNWPGDLYKHSRGQVICIVNLSLTKIFKYFLDNNLSLPKIRVKYYF